MEKELNDFERFAKDLCDIVSETLKAFHNVNAEVKPIHVLKANGEEIGISIKQDGKDVAPTIYPTEEYERFKAGESLEDIAKDTCRIAVRALSEKVEMPTFNVAEAEKHITLCLINTARNNELLKSVPHYEIGDVSAYPRWEMDAQKSFIFKMISLHSAV